MRLTLAVIAITAASASCPSEDWQEFFGMCYWRSSFSMPWTSVASACQSLFPGSQAVISSDFTINSFLSDRVMHGERAWIGLCCEGDCIGRDDFRWLDGSPLDSKMAFWDDHVAYVANGSRCAFINENAVGPYGSWYDNVDDDPAFPILCQLNAPNE